jgi:hypothetical protein
MVALVVLVDELLEVGEFLGGEDDGLVWMPALRAFMEEVALPLTEVGRSGAPSMRRSCSSIRR